MVDVDAPVGVCRTELCEVAGVELSSAPRRPINYKTLLKKMDFLPYGENLDKDANRLAYYKQIRGYIKSLVEPAIVAHGAASADGMPQHLQKVSLVPQCCTVLLDLRRAAASRRCCFAAACIAY